MPIYEYRHTDGFEEPCKQDILEVFQTMSAPEMSICPNCGKPIQKLISMPARHQQHINNTLNEKNIAEKGFSKYVKTEDGKYEKAAGPAEAPATLDRGTMAENLKHLD